MSSPSKMVTELQKKQLDAASEELKKILQLTEVNSSASNVSDVHAKLATALPNLVASLVVPFGADVTGKTLAAIETRFSGGGATTAGAGSASVQQDDSEGDPMKLLTDGQQVQFRCIDPPVSADQAEELYHKNGGWITWKDVYTVKKKPGTKSTFFFTSRATGKNLQILKESDGKGSARKQGGEGPWAAFQVVPHPSGTGGLQFSAEGFNGDKNGVLGWEGICSGSIDPSSKHTRLVLIKEGEATPSFATGGGKVATTGGAGANNLPEEGTVYEIEPRHAPGMRLDVNGAKKDNGTKIQLWTRHGGPNQQFTARQQGSGVWYFVAMCSGQAVIDKTGKTGQQCHIWNHTSKGKIPSNGLFLLNHVDGDFFHVSLEGDPSYRWDCSGSKKDNGTPLMTYQGHNNPNQQFRFIKSSAPQQAPAPTPTPKQQVSPAAAPSSSGGTVIPLPALSGYHQSPESVVSKAQMAFFHKYGFVVLPKVVPKDVLARAQQSAYQHVIDDPITEATRVKFRGLPEGNRNKWSRMRDPAIVASWEDVPALAASLQTIVGTKNVGKGTVDRLLARERPDGGSMVFAVRFTEGSPVPGEEMKNACLSAGEKMAISPATKRNAPLNPGDVSHQYDKKFLEEAAALGMRFAPCHHPNWHQDGEAVGAPWPPFNVLTGTYLSDTPHGEMGNLIVYPGSHHVLWDHYRKHGTSWFCNMGKGEQLGKKPALDGGAQFPNSGTPFEVCVGAGDVLIATPTLAHGIGLNKEKQQPRLALYYRFNDHSVFGAQKEKASPGNTFSGSQFEIQPGLLQFDGK